MTSPKEEALGATTEGLPKNSNEADENLKAHHTADGRQTAYDHADAWWKSCANQAMKALVDAGAPFTVDEFSRLVPQPDRPERTGAIVAAWYRQRKIQVVGAALSGEDGRPVRIWQAVGGGQ